MDGGREVAGLRRVLLRYDALAERSPDGRRILVFDSPPRPGDRVLVIDGKRARVVPFEEYTAPGHRVWLVAVVRAAGAALGVVALLG